MRQILSAIALIVVLSPQRATAENIQLDTNGDVVDNDCRYRIQDLIDAKKRGSVIGGVLMNSAINRHTDICNLVRAKQWKQSEERWKEHNRNMVIEDLRNHSERLTRAAESAQKELEKSNEDFRRRQRALQNMPTTMPSTSPRGSFSDRCTFFPEKCQ